MFEWFCRREKLKTIWEERTSYNCPFAIKIGIDECYKPYASFTYEVYRIDDIDLFFETDFKNGATPIKKRISRTAKYSFGKGIEDYLWFKRRGYDWNQ